MRVRSSFAVLVLMTALLRSSPASAQNNRFTERAFVPAPSVRAMGDAGVALQGTNRAFFSNPAQLPHISSHFTILGVQAAASRDLKDQIDFFNDRIQPAIDANFELETEALDELYREAYRFGRTPVRGDGAVVFPSVVYSSGGFGIGGGLFAKTALNYRVSGTELGVPEIFLLSRTDVMAVASLGLELDALGLPGVSLGATATRTRRFLTFENKPLDTFTADETALLLEGNTFQIDVGGLYTPSWWSLPGTLTVGGAVYDLLGRRYEYAFSGAPRIPFLEGIAANPENVDAGVATREAERARRRFRLRTSYRVGVAYRRSSLFFLDEVGLALDYQGYGTDEQHPLARLHLGARAKLGNTLVLRSGLSGGYPTGGLGLRFGLFRVDYAFHAFEEGRVPGRLETYVHTARLTIRVE